MDERQQCYRLLALLLAWSILLSDGAAAADDHGSDLHPVVLIPGGSCSQLEAELSQEYKPSAALCGARKGTGWFRLWKNSTALRNPDEAACYAEQLRVVYDRGRCDYRNVAGVRTRVVSFGTTRGFGPDIADDDPSDAERDQCMNKLVKALEEIGYKEAKNLFGATYDFRYSPAGPGENAAVFSFLVADLTRLIEHASRKNSDKPVILVTHSLGGSVAMEFLKHSPIPWRATYVKHLVMVSTGAGGIVAPLETIAAYSKSATEDALEAASRSYGSIFWPLPSPRVFGDAPLVVTRYRSYTAGDIAEFLMAAGFSDEEVELYRTRALPVTLGFTAPRVPMTAIYGAGVPTPERLVYWDGDFSKDPELVYGDGDGTVNLASLLALDTLVGDDPDQVYFKHVKIDNATHTGIIIDELAMKRVIAEILEANHAFVLSTKKIVISSAA